jgi:hypothetical protein
MSVLITEGNRRHWLRCNTAVLKSGHRIAPVQEGREATYDRDAFISNSWHYISYTDTAFSSLQQ